MLTRGGPFDEYELAEKAKEYIPLYTTAPSMKNIEECFIPYREASTGKVNYVVFTWLAGQWVYTDIRKKNKKPPKG
jgi:hypothetical protein